MTFPSQISLFFALNFSEKSSDNFVLRFWYSFDFVCLITSPKLSNGYMLSTAPRSVLGFGIGNSQLIQFDGLTPSLFVSSKRSPPILKSQMYLICLRLKATLCGTGFAISKPLFAQLPQHLDTSQSLYFPAGADTHTS